LKRAQLEHVLRAASRITGDRDVLVLGSQSVLGSAPEDELPDEAVTSIQVDLAFLGDPDLAKADRVGAVIGELSTFHETFGYYAHGTAVAAVVLPPGWQQRLVAVESANTAPGRGLCLDPHDCVVAKLIAGRRNDTAFAEALIRTEIVSAAVLNERVGTLTAERPVVLDRIRRFLARQL
jgi:hypothetical protein